ncbi:DUF445 family protein [Tissierella sp.]|uniref:DUF445 family protein n=1 Tax=Tissierella sp. TaxID=41274 RepID=UPI0028559F57|nr:DUF445 family protein [Tissierella sp.]MDR7855577.1 DUF445 family protein [Tissierella sp.]
MKFLVPIIVGAVIGYFTNWLAIKMLFRPHYEKRIFGMKLPFTPGLIPKERERIGKSIGETVGVYLLSPDTIMESLSSKKTEEQTKQWIESKLTSLRENDATIKEILTNLSDEDYGTIVKAIEGNLVDIVLQHIRKDKFKSKISNIIRANIEELDTDHIYERLDKKLAMILLDISRSTDLRTGLINFMELKLKELSVNEKNVSEIIPIEITNSINKYIDENGYRIGNIIRDNFNDPIVQAKLKASISDLVSKNMSKLIITFISADTISEKIFQILEKYIASEEANKDIIMILESSIHKAMESKASDIFPEIIDSFGVEGLSNIADLIIAYIEDENNHKSLLEIIQNKLKDEESNNKGFIIDYLSKSANLILDSKEASNTLVLFLDDIVQHFMSKPISFYCRNIDEHTASRVYTYSRLLFDKFIRTEMSKIVEIIDISGIVEEKINSFDVNFTEKLILDIADRELKAITWLGGLLGGIIGILTPLIQLLY